MKNNFLYPHIKNTLKRPVSSCFHYPLDISDFIQDPKQQPVPWTYDGSVFYDFCDYSVKYLNSSSCSKLLASSLLSNSF
jgi:hypothetical protein